MFGDGTLFPGDFGMKDIGEDGCEQIRNNASDPKKLVILEDDAG